MGDYIYEYAQGEYANPALAGLRDVVPANETVSLLDYRLRHALYKSDPDLQEAHRQHPFICVWDDHESADNSWENGAANHNPDQGEGDWQVRKRASIRAYNEYMPIRSTSVSDDKIFRHFPIGNLADLIMLDTRLNGRDLQAMLGAGSQLPANDPVISDPNRTLLGFDQEQWLEQQLVQSRQRRTRWRILGQQVMMAQLSSTFGQTIMNPDQWDGYRPARERLYRVLSEGRINNNVVLTGDIHSSWCNELTVNPFDPTSYNPLTGKGLLGVEFVTPGVSSPGAPDPVTAAAAAAELRLVSPHIRYIDLYERGYGVLDVNHERTQAEIYHVATVDTRSNVERLAAAFVSEAGANSLKPVNVSTSGLPLSEPAPEIIH